MTSRLNPYLNFNGNARQAIEFYASVFGGEATFSTFADFGAQELTERRPHHARATRDRRRLHDHGCRRHQRHGLPPHGRVLGLPSAVTTPARCAAGGRGFRERDHDDADAKAEGGRQVPACASTGRGVPWLINISQPQA